MALLVSVGNCGISAAYELFWFPTGEFRDGSRLGTMHSAWLSYKRSCYVEKIVLEVPLGYQIHAKLLLCSDTLSRFFFLSYAVSCEHIPRIPTPFQALWGSPPPPARSQHLRQALCWASSFVGVWLDGWQVLVPARVLALISPSEGGRPVALTGLHPGAALITLFKRKGCLRPSLTCVRSSQVLTPDQPAVAVSGAERRWTCVWILLQPSDSLWIFMMMSCSCLHYTELSVDI